MIPFCLGREGGMLVRALCVAVMVSALPCWAMAQSAAPRFPSSVDAKYAGENAGRARLHTCRDQYRANKAGGGNGGLKWIQKGGGYYTACLKKLK